MINRGVGDGPWVVFMWGERSATILPRPGDRPFAKAHLVVCKLVPFVDAFVTEGRAAWPMATSSMAPLLPLPRERGLGTKKLRSLPR